MIKPIRTVLSSYDIKFLSDHNISIPDEKSKTFNADFDVMYTAIEDLEIDNLGVDYTSNETSNHANTILNKLAAY
ncbi:hypothetical protein [Pediococcus ethanolidurans]|uniref:Uncharacterized protein n=1 Tax=Pediococcus ethanolidurans TaxID=319653 RepID=A0A1H9N6S9_9LACO|nr:hypothetical protein [Pediococcus ethanolidurans]GEN94628.1 hypothetical protein PET01_06780 [Pediococcus ethanolidurans]SER31379.1 hypothetical protein SAMN04487973_104107 [Pediococcus ethanolidurans]